jgi:hypothetical protein
MEHGDKTVLKKNAAIFIEGAKIEAKDHQGAKWWEAKVDITPWRQVPGCRNTVYVELKYSS